MFTIDYVNWNLELPKESLTNRIIFSQITLHLKGNIQQHT